MTRALIGLDGPFDPVTEAFMGDGAVLIEAFCLRSRMLHVLRTESPSPVVRAALESVAEDLRALYAQTWKARALPAHNPLAPSARRRVPPFGGMCSTPRGCPFHP